MLNPDSTLPRPTPVVKPWVMVERSSRGRTKGPRPGLRCGRPPCGVGSGTGGPPLGWLTSWLPRKPGALGKGRAQTVCFYQKALLEISPRGEALQSGKRKVFSASRRLSDSQENAGQQEGLEELVRTWLWPP